jgi:hypothetical protein
MCFPYPNLQTLNLLVTNTLAYCCQPTAAVKKKHYITLDPGQSKLEQCLRFGSAAVAPKNLAPKAENRKVPGSSLVQTKKSPPVIFKTSKMNPAMLAFQPGVNVVTLFFLHLSRGGQMCQVFLPRLCSLVRPSSLT